MAQCGGAGGVMMAQSALRYPQSSFKNVGWRQEGHPAEKNPPKPTIDADPAYEELITTLNKEEVRMTSGYIFDGLI